MRAIVLAVLVLIGLVTVAPRPTAAGPSALCEAAAANAARRVGVPERVLRAIALVETGRRIDGQHRPWPWAANLHGQGYWFADRASALSWFEARRAEGQRLFDVGCFQVNYRWHGHRFRDLAQMLDPEANATYAAMFLADLYAETGDWAAAAAAYHSRTPLHASRYRARFEQVYASLDAPGGRSGPVRPTRVPGVPGQMLSRAAPLVPGLTATGGAAGGLLVRPGGGPLLAPAPGALF